MKLLNGPSAVVYLTFMLVSPIFAQTFTDASSLLSPDHPIPGREFLRGASAADFNNDGLVDLYHPNFREPGRLYLNRAGDGFVDLLPRTGIDEGTNMWGAAFGDYNNDGYLDILFEDLSAASKLYLNNRNSTFTLANGIAGLYVNTLAQGAAWADYNLDGKLDLIVVNDFGANQLFRNDDYDTFTNVTTTAQVETFGNSYGVSWGDINNDLYPDAFITTCHRTDPLRSIKHLLLNNGDETFTDINTSAGVADSLASWGVVFLDYDNDGDFDIYVANSAHPPRPGFNRLYRNDGALTFSNVSVAAGVAGESDENSYCIAEADFDNDGFVDLYVSELEHLDRLYRNNGDATFTDVAPQAGIPFNEHRAIAVADLNDDGWIDIFSAGNDQNLILLNDGGDNHWIRFSLRGIASNYDGVGTRIEVYTDTLQQLREIRAGDSFCSQNHDLTAHFGLGQITTIDSVVLRWPSGTVDKILALDAIDRHVTFVEGQGFNGRPATFRLLEPAEDDTVTGDGMLRWNASGDPDGDNLIYNIHLTSRDLATNVRSDTTFSDISDTATVFTWPGITTVSEIVWSVESSDGQLITSCMQAGRFVFQPDVTGIAAGTELLGSFHLAQNYPNPFNPTTSVSYVLAGSGDIELAIYNILGERVRMLVLGHQQAGEYTVSWDGKNSRGEKVSGGIYFYRLQAGGYVAARRMILLK